MIDIPFRSKERSWLSFNSRVLQEAKSPDVPLLERIKFLGIYSSNLDEFFRVRVATLRRLIGTQLPFDRMGMPEPAKTLKEVLRTLKAEAEEFNRAYTQVFRELEKEGIRLITEKQVPEAMKPKVDEYFRKEVLPRLMPIMIKADCNLGGMKDRPMYLSGRMGKESGRTMHALLEIPQDLPRFHVLPENGPESLVMYLDDVIRFGVHRVFEGTNYDHFESYAVKFTRDAEIEVDSDFNESLMEQLSEGLKAREEGLPVRVNYDQELPESFLTHIRHALALTDRDMEFPGARYHNRKDLQKFPNFGRVDLCRKPVVPVFPPRLQADRDKGIMRAMRRHDVLLHFPFHSYSHFLDLLRQASIDPLVKSISITHYRLAANSCVARALMTAAKNEKAVTVLVEPAARFDEQANLDWAHKYKDAGVHVILGVPGLKVHTKLCLIERLEHGNTRYYSCIGTGNFNEETAKVYTDHMLLTCHQEIGNDLARIFLFFRKNYLVPSQLDHLICAPFSLRERLYEMIDHEVREAELGRHAEIWVKINNLADLETVRRLYCAAKAGVKMRLIVRSMFSLMTEQPDCSETIQAVGIVDHLLEHTRILRFHNGGAPRYFLASADFLPRNFDSRCETLTPVYDPALQEELGRYLELQWQDNVKARRLDAQLSNRVHNEGQGPAIRAQVAIEEYLRELSELAEEGGR